MAELSVAARTPASGPLDRARLALTGAGYLVAGFVAIAAGLFALAIYLGWNETLDDTAISLAYAKNLIHGHGLVLTEHAEPVEGYSNFLWVVIMAPVIGVGIDGIIASKLIGLAFGAGALLVLTLLPGAVARRPVRWFDLLAPALTALSVPYALWSISGLENGLESFLIILALYLTVREVDDATARPWSAVAFFALALTRPDGVVFWVAAIGHRMLLYALGRRQLRQDVTWLFVCLVPLGVYHAWHYAYFGELVPNTYYAKASERTIADLPDYLTLDDPGVRYLRSFAEDYWVVMPLAPVALAAIAGARRLSHYSLPLLMLAAGTMAVLFSAGDWMPHYRFISPLLPLFFLCVIQGSQVCAEVIVRILRTVTPRVALASAAVLVAGTAAVNLPYADDVHDKPYGAEYDVILSIGRYLEGVAAEVGVDEPLVALPDVGAVAYATDIEIIDLAGLADAHIARNPAGRDFGTYLFNERRPDIIYTHGPWTRRAGLELDPRLLEGYVVWDQVVRDGVLASATYVKAAHVLQTSSCEGAVPWSDPAFAAGSRTLISGPIVAVEGGRLGPSLQMGGIGGGPSWLVTIPRDLARNLPLPAEDLYLGKTVCVSGTAGTFLGLRLLTVDSLDAMAVQAS